MQSAASSGSPRFSESEKRIIFGGLMLGMLLAALDQTIVATALPAMARDLHGMEHMSWVVSGYLLTATAVTPIYGKLSDLYGRKRLLQVAISSFVLASLLCGLAQTMAQLVLCRALQGLGGGGLMAMAHATIADVVSPRERGRYQGYFSSVFAAASVAGPVLGGLFSDYLTWRWVFWINLPIGLAAFIICDFALRKLAIKGVRRRIDYPGALLLMLGVGQLLLVTTWGGTAYPWGSPVILALTVSGLALLAVFALVELRTAEAILPPRLFRNKVFAVSSVITFLASMAMFAGILYLPLFLQLVSGVRAEQSGFMLIPLTAGIVVGAYSAGRTASATGRYKAFPLVGLAVATGVFLLLSHMDGRTGLTHIMVLLGFLGFGIGLVLPIMVVAVQNAIEPADLGSGTASVSFFRSMGGSFGVALVGAVVLQSLDKAVAGVPGSAALGPDPAVTLLRGDTSAFAHLDAALKATLGDALTHAFSQGFLTAAVIAGLGFLATVLLKELPLRSDMADSSREALERLQGPPATAAE